MKKHQIEIGGIYIIKLDGFEHPVRVVRTGSTVWHKFPRTSYLCRSLLTDEEVRVTSVTRFQRRATDLEVKAAEEIRR